MRAPSAGTQPRHYGPLFEGLALLAVTLPLALGLHLPTLWLIAPLLLITLCKRPYAMYGLSWQRPGSWRFHLTVSLVVFVPYVIGFCLWAHVTSGAIWRFRLPPDFTWSVVDQVLLIALPEEFFFRGYLQTQIDRVFGTPFRLFGARYGWGLPLAAALFALCHLVHGGPARLSVFFPGLWYGWLKARTGTIAVPTGYHAVSNLLMALLLTGLAPG